MRTLLFFVVFAVFVSAANAQVTSARSLTKRIAPLTTPPPPARPGQVAVPTAVAPPADPAKVKAGADEADRKRLEYQTKEAGKGSPTAQYDLGVRRLTGNGLEKNLDEATRWFELAEKNGNTQATKKLLEIKKLKK